MQKKVSIIYRPRRLELKERNTKLDLVVLTKVSLFRKKDRLKNLPATARGATGAFGSKIKEETKLERTSKTRWSKHNSTWIAQIPGGKYGEEIEVAAAGWAAVPGSLVAIAALKPNPSLFFWEEKNQTIRWMASNLKCRSTYATYFTTRCLPSPTLRL